MHSRKFLLVAAALCSINVFAQSSTVALPKEQVECLQAENEHREKNGARFDFLFRAAMDSYRGAQQCLGVNARNTVGPGAFVCGQPAPHFVLGEIEEGSAASRSGLREGDVLVSLGGAPITYHLDFENQLMAQKPGAVVVVEVSRNGELLRREVQVGLLQITPPVTEFNKKVESSEERLRQLMRGPTWAPKCVTDR